MPALFRVALPMLGLPSLAFGTEMLIRVNPRSGEKSRNEKD
jgi:hypothetical protein